MEPLPHEAGADPQDMSHLFRFHAFKIPQDEHRPLIVRQPPKSFPDLRPHLVPLHGYEGQRILAPVSQSVRIHKMPVGGKTWQKIFDVVFPAADAGPAQH